MLSEEADLLQRHDKNLFGKTFSELLVASAKGKKLMKMFAEKSKKKQKLFWIIPSETPSSSFEGQHSNFFLDKDTENQGNYFWWKLRPSNSNWKKQ